MIPGRPAPFAGAPSRGKVGCIGSTLIEGGEDLRPIVHRLAVRICSPDEETVTEVVRDIRGDTVIDGICVVPAGVNHTAVWIQPLPGVRIEEVELLIGEELLPSRPNIGHGPLQIGWKLMLKSQVPLIRLRIYQVIVHRLNSREGINLWGKAGNRTGSIWHAPALRGGRQRIACIWRGSLAVVYDIRENKVVEDTETGVIDRLPATKKSSTLRCICHTEARREVVYVLIDVELCADRSKRIERIDRRIIKRVLRIAAILISQAEVERQLR